MWKEASAHTALRAVPEQSTHPWLLPIGVPAALGTPGSQDAPVPANPGACLRLAGLKTKPVACVALDSALE